MHRHDLFSFRFGISGTSGKKRDHMSEIPNNPSLRWLLENLGATRTFELSNLFGYSRIYVPKTKSKLKSDFSKFLNADDLSRFQQFWAGNYVLIPLARDFRCKFMSERLGLGAAEISRRVMIKEDSVRRAIKRVNTKLVWLELNKRGSANA